MIRIAIVMVNYRNAEETILCLESLEASRDRASRDGGHGATSASGEGFGIFLVENGSGDGSDAVFSAYLKAHPLPVRYLSLPENLGFAGGSNAGVRLAMELGYTHIVFLNNDTRAEPDFVAALYRAAAADPEKVLAGYIGEMESGRPAHNLGSIGRWTGLVRFHFPERHADPPPFDFVSACLMVVPSQVLRKTGLLDEAFFMYCEDLEFSMRLKRDGVPLRYVPALGIRHRVSFTVTRTNFPKDYYRMRNQTYTMLRGGTGAQRLIYLVRIAGVMLLKSGNPGLFRQFAAGIKDGLAGRLGHNPGMRA